ncbi:MAG TPA: DUF4388 domain-containing protein [Acidimicrobiales bacterium]|nr:DUF4388 domain-containing protein [Acidimicrobiales bacterium]
MPLAGTFDVLDFGEILGLLSKRSATGRLQVRCASMHGTIWLSGGRATAAEIGSGSTGLGGIPYGEGRTKWQSLLEDICFDALRAPRGSFEFHPEDEVNIPAGPRVSVDEVVEAGNKRLEMWREVESVIHSFEAVPRLAEALNDDSLVISQERWRILVAVDGRRSVAALARRMDTELLEFCQMLKPMIESGAVLLDQPDGFMKSLPKVRLDVVGRDGDWTESNGGSLPDGTPILNVGSTVVDGPVRPVPPTPPTQTSGEQIAAARAEHPAGDPPIPPDLHPVDSAAGDDDAPGPDPAPRRRLRGRSRSRARVPGSHFDE